MRGILNVDFTGRAPIPKIFFIRKSKAKVLENCSFIFIIFFRGREGCHGPHEQMSPMAIFNRPFEPCWGKVSNHQAGLWNVRELVKQLGRVGDKSISESH